MIKEKNSRYKLIVAMAELILEKGLANTSPQDVLDRANLGKGSFYHYFKRKEDLAYYAIKFNVDKLIDESSRILATKNSAAEKIKVFLSKKRDIDRGCLVGQMARDSMIMSHPKLSSEVTRGFEWVKQTLKNLVYQGVLDGAICSRFGPLEATTITLAVLQGSYVTAKGLKDETYFNIGLEVLKKILFVSDDDLL